MKLQPARIAIAISFTLAACTPAPHIRCLPGDRQAVVETIYFGTAKASGLVTIEQWQEFVNQIVTPHFPQGLTWWTANGQWRNAAGIIEQETSYILQVVHPKDQSVEASIVEMAMRYRDRFDQESVLWLRSPTCASFLDSGSDPPR
jgi:hypothetical protein